MKKKAAIISVSLLVVLLVGALIYTRPMTLARLCSGVDVAQSEKVCGYHLLAPDTDPVYFEIDSDDERFARIVEAFGTRTFCRSLISLLPQGTKTHATRDGDFRWEVMFELEEVAFPDGSVNSGMLIRASDFFGILEVGFNGVTWRCSTNDNEAWRSDVMSLISGAR